MSADLATPESAAIDDDALRLAGVRHVRREDAATVTLAVRVNAAVDAALLRVADYFDDSDEYLRVNDALLDLAVAARNAQSAADDNLHSRSLESAQETLRSALRAARNALDLPATDEVVVPLYGTTAVLLAERLIAEAGPAAVAARGSLTLARAVALAEAG